MPPSKQRNQPLRATLPETRFLYTLDQIAGLLGFGLPHFKREYVFYEGISHGGQPRGKLRARDVSPDFGEGKLKDQRDWRVSEDELLRWMRFKHYRIYRRTIHVEATPSWKED